MSKILIIEDDDYTLKALQSRLEKEEFEVITAESGYRGLELARESRPFLIILDLLMPDIDGLEVLERLRQDVVTWDTPVVVLTARQDAESRERSQQLGVLRFFRKPFSPRRLALEVKRLLLEPPFAS
ncbi:MAG: response regulator [Chloroflexota bacterium]|nr:response regulator [Chloroflexota bacterium]